MAAVPKGGCHGRVLLVDSVSVNPKAMSPSRLFIASATGLQQHRLFALLSLMYCAFDDATCSAKLLS